MRKPRENSIMSLAHEHFKNLPRDVQTALMTLRRVILDTAKSLPDVGPLEEALRWGQLSFLTSQSKSGSTIRIDAVRDDPTKYAMFLHCQSGLIDDFRQRYPGIMTFVDQRSIEFSLGKPVPMAELKHCISLALTYHSRKKRAKLQRKK
jgi:Domain of unknown function (DU1801)